MKTGDVITIMVLRHGKRAPRGSKLIPLRNHHGAYSSLAILPVRRKRIRRRA